MNWGFHNIPKTFSNCCLKNVFPLLSYNIVEMFYNKHDIIWGPNNMLKTFSKCCFQNVLPLFSCNILRMFYRRTFYYMLPHRHPQNIPRMLHLKLPSFVNISHYKKVLEKWFGIVGLNNILKTFSSCCIDSVLPLLSYNVGNFL